MIALLALLVVADPMPAERIDRGMKALEALDYDVAAFELAIAATDPRANEKQRVQAHLYAGIAQRVLGHDTEARLHFLYVFRHAPEMELPEGQPPKIRTFWELVRSEIGLERRTRSDDMQRSDGVAKKLTPSAPAPTSESSTAPGTAAPAVNDTPAQSGFPVLGVSAGVAGAAALGFVAAGAVFGMSSLDKSALATRAQFQDDAVSALNDARNDAIAADACYVAAGVLGVGAAALGVWAMAE